MQQLHQTMQKLLLLAVQSTLVFILLACIPTERTAPMRYRPATAQEIQQAADELDAIRDTEAVLDYARAIFGPTVARVRLVIDHNFDDGEETRYVQGDFYGATRPSTYQTVQLGNLWFQPDALHRGWDADGNELPILATFRDNYLYDTEGNEIESPDLTTYDAWHMEFDFTQAPTQAPTLYVAAGDRDMTWGSEEETYQQFRSRA